MLDAASAESIFFFNLKNYDKNHIKIIILSGDAQFSGIKHRHMVVIARLQSFFILSTEYPSL